MGKGHYDMMEGIRFRDDRQHQMNSCDGRFKNDLGWSAWARDMDPAPQRGDPNYTLTNGIKIGEAINAATVGMVLYNTLNKTK